MRKHDKTINNVEAICKIRYHPKYFYLELSFKFDTIQSIVHLNKIGIYFNIIDLKKRFIFKEHDVCLWIPTFQLD